MSECEITIDSSSSDEEVDECIRVIWEATMKLHLISITPRQSLEKVFTELAQIHQIPTELIMITYKDETVSHTDTLESLGFRVAFDRLMANKRDKPLVPVSRSLTEPGPNRLLIKCNAKNRKHPFQYYLAPNQAIQLIVEQCAKDLGTSPNNVRIKLDGEVLSPKDTPLSLDLEGGECFDVHIT